MPAPRPLSLTLRVTLWRARRPLAALACVAALLAVARTLAPDPPPTTPVTVTSRAVAAGHALTDADVRTVAWPRHLAPAGGVAEADARGRTSLVDLPPGVPLVPGVLAGERYDVAVPPGTVVVPVRLADPAVTSLLRPGDRVDLVRPTDAGPHEVVARRALVLRTDEPTGGGGPLGLGVTATGSAHAVVAVAPDEGRALAAAGAWGDLGAVIVDG